VDACCLSTADEADDLDSVTFAQTAELELGSIQDVEIQFNGNPVWSNVQFPEQTRNGQIWLCAPSLAVDLYLDLVQHRRLPSIAQDRGFIVWDRRRPCQHGLVRRLPIPFQTTGMLSCCIAQP
jgi:hypothetical protein